MIKLLEDSIFCFDNYLSTDSCNKILYELKFSYWQPSTIIKKDNLDGKFKSEVNEFRISETSHQQWFSYDLNSEINKIEERLKSEFKVDPAYLEPWQALNYSQNGKVDYHLDSGYWQDDFGGERVLTFLIYLTTPEQGGETHFRAYDLKVEAVQGRMLVWENLLLNGKANHRLIHSGLPVLSGNKTCILTWSRKNKYRL